LYANTTGNANNAFGYNSLTSNTTGSNNIAIGPQALQANTTASNNTAVGYQAGYANTTGNIDAVGVQVLYRNTTGVGNVGFGGSYVASINPALTYNTTGSYNTGIGMGALASNTTASNNTAVGYQAGYSNTTNGSNLYVGYQTALSATGTKNTFLGGYQSGYYVTSGSKNTILGNYDGYYGGSLDIRTASNYIVLSDGDGNPRIIVSQAAGLTVSTSNVAIGAGTIAGAVGKLYFVTGYNGSSGAQGWWLIGSYYGSLTVISSNNNTGLTVNFTKTGDQLYMNTSSGTVMTTYREIN
jgi:hypothetical protein